MVDGKMKMLCCCVRRRRRKGLLLFLSKAPPNFTRLLAVDRSEVLACRVFGADWFSRC